MKELYCKVYGNVQGVFFRSFAQNEARARGIVGYVKNLPEGTVEIVAHGDEVNLREFLTKISSGPVEAEVESVDVNWGPVGADDERFSDFAIL